MLGDGGRVGKRSAGHDRRERSADQRIVIADASGAPREVDAELQRRKDRIAADGNRRARRGRLVTVRDSLQRFRLGIGNQPLAVHRHGINGSQVTEPLRIGCAGGYFREADGFERPLYRRKKIRRARRHRFGRARDHLLRAAAGRNQPDARLHQSDVAFRRRLHAVTVHGDLAAAAERHPRGSNDHGYIRVSQRHRRVLERAHHQVHFVPVLLLRFEEQQHDVRAGGEVLAFVADDERGKIRRGLFQPGVQHLDSVAADRVHLRVEFDAQHAVAEIDKAGARVLPDDTRAVLCGFEQLQIGCGWRDFSNATLDRLVQLERAELPSEPPPHDAIDIVGRVRDLRSDLLRVFERWLQRRAQEFADPVLSVVERANALAQIRNGSGGFERAELRGRARPVLER